MKQVILFTFIVVALAASAQGPTLTSTSAPQPGDVFITQPVRVAGISTVNSGANQTWNYSAAIDTGASTREWVVAASSTPYASSYPGATVCLVDTFGADSAFAYEAVTSSSLTVLGTYIPGSIGVFYNPGRAAFQYPLAYGDSRATVYAGTSLSGDSITGVDSFTADGYGTLRVPGQTYQNVLRIKYIMHTHSVNSGFGFFADFDQVEYSFYIPGYHGPLMGVQYSTVNTNGTIAYGTTAQYAKSVSTGIADVTDAASISIYPNPNHGLFSLHTSDESLMGTEMSVTNLTGQTIAEEKISSARQTIDLRNAAAGLYILNIKNGQWSISKKLVVE